MKYDVAIIGSGPGGYVAAIRAAQLGKKIILIEKNKLGGVCLNQGCIPTKILLHSGEMLHKAQQFSKYGIKCSNIEFNIATVVKRAQNISKKLVEGIKMLIKKGRIDLIYGTCYFKDRENLSVTTKEGEEKIFNSKNTIIATGASPRSINGVTIDHKRIWDYNDALFSGIIPKSITIIGSGAIGIEFASFYNHVGVNVNVLEAKDEILSSEDREIIKIAKKSFEKRGIKFHTAVEVLEVRSDSNLVRIKYKQNQSEEITISSEILLIAAGVEANIKDLRLENIGLKPSKNIIETDANMETNVSGIYAIGDVTRGPWLAHKASHEGMIASESIANLTHHKIDYNNIPACIYSSPEIARIGLTEEEAIKKGYKIRVGRFPFYANGKALIIDDSEGMIKNIFDDRTGELLGVHMIGSYVTELINGYSIAKSSELTDEDLMNTIFPHPSLSEMVHEASLNANERSVHI